MESGRIIHETNSGRDSKPVVLMFEGNSVFWVMGGLMLSLLLFRHLHGNLHWSTLESLIAAAVPLAVAVTYVLTLKQGKPPHFDGELFEWLGFRLREAAAEMFRLPLRSFLHPAPAKKPHPLKPQATAGGGVK